MFIFEPLSLLVVQFQVTQGYLDPVSRKERQRQTHRETDTWWGRKKITKQQIYGCVSWETAFSTAVVKAVYRRKFVLGLRIQRVQSLTFMAADRQVWLWSGS